MRLIPRLKYGRLNIQPLINKDDHIEFSNGTPLDIIKETYKEWAEEYSREACYYEHPPIDWYCGFMHEEINQKLRDIIPELSSHLTDITKNLSSIILKAPRIPYNLVAYRVLDKKVIETFIQDHKKGRQIIDSGFMSTSLIYDCLSDKEFQHYNGILKLFIPAHTPAIYIDLIKTRYLSGRNEQEILIHPNASIQIISQPYNIGKRLCLECSLKHNVGYDSLINI